MQRYLKNPVPAVVTTGFEDFRKDGSGPMTLLERKGGSVGGKWLYSFNRQNGKKLIPVYGFEPFTT